MNEQDCVALLEQHDIRPTANRIVVVKALAAARRPLALTELEQKIQTVDKSGISRALSLFREHHLVHVLEDSSYTVRYELCHSHHADVDDDQHVHFYCEQCQRTFCLDGIPVPEVPLPDGYHVYGANYILKGICPDCRKR